MQKPNFFVITGGPGSGKTTLLREFQKRGLKCVPEVAREIIQEQVASGGNALPWKDRQLYTDMMLRRSIESYRLHASSDKPIFFDRGIPDTLCYARLIGMNEISSIHQACEEFRYATKVLIAPPWKEIYETDSKRRQDFDEAQRTYELMSRTYRDCGYEVEELPKTTPERRAEYVLEILQLDSF